MGSKHQVTKRLKSLTKTDGENIIVITAMVKGD
jgi:hypothetical protein